MKQLKKTLLTLVALLAVTTGAWAEDVITVTWSSGDTYENNNSKDGVTLSGDIVRYFIGEWKLAYDKSKGTFTTELGNFTKIEITGGYINGFSGEGWSSGRTWTGNAAAVPFGGYITDDSGEQPWTITFTIEPASSPSSGPEVAWNKAEKTGSFTMPGGNVTLEPDYYPQATLTAAPTAINDVPATTDGAIVNAGTVASIGETANAQGTVMYYVSPTALDDAALQALAADQWTADVPTAAGLAQGPAYVYYYVRGNDSDNDDEIFSDGDILAANALTVTIAAEPTYAVTFADGVNPEPPAEPEWTASPAADVKKGQTVTVTYTGTKKVIGVKAEKKAASLIVNPEVGQVIGSDGKNYAYASLPTGVTAVAKICYVSGSNGLALALADEESYMNWSTAIETCAAHTPAITGGTWKLATKDEWSNMITAAGSHTALRNGFSSVGGTNMQSNAYWSSTEEGSDNAWSYFFGYGVWGVNNKDLVDYVRACLAF